MIRYNYNRQLTPPAPFVHVNFKHPDQDAILADVPAQLDPAADMTVVPRGLIDQLQVVPLDLTSVLGFDANIVELPTFLVELWIRGFSAFLVKVLASESEPFVLLGRDVLNRYRVLLDGPRLVLEIQA